MVTSIDGLTDLLARQRALSPTAAAAAGEGDDDDNDEDGSRSQARVHATIAAGKSPGCGGVVDEGAGVKISQIHGMKVASPGVHPITGQHQNPERTDLARNVPCPPRPQPALLPPIHLAPLLSSCWVMCAGICVCESKQRAESRWRAEPKTNGRRYPRERRDDG